MFKSGDTVSVKDRKLAYYGEVVATLPDDEVRVRMMNFRKPKERGVCDKCGGMNLSRNGGTGQITCMSSGCGHDHGFEKWDEIIHTTKLINLMELKKNKAKGKKGEFQKEVGELFARGVKDGLMTQNQAEAMMVWLRRTS